MYKHILITTDGSSMAQKGVDHGIALAKVTGARVTILTVTPPFPMLPGVMGEGSYASAAVLDDYDAGQRQAAEEILLPCQAQAEGLDAKVLHIPDARPADAILRSADELDCDLICMASHGRRGVKRLLLGSQAAEVVAHSARAVLIVRG